MRPGELVLVTGMTGAGRSTAAKELEDLGFYVVDNLPPTLLKDVVALVDESRGPTQQIAVVVDVRSGDFFADLEDNLHHGASGRHATLLFLEASDEVLVRRQEAARRPHPLQGTAGCSTGCSASARCWPGSAATPTSSSTRRRLNVHQLTDRIAEEFGTPETVRLRVSVVSFGFKYGIPVDADFVADMRFLPNPFWVPELQAADRPGPGGVRLRPRARTAPRSSWRRTPTCSPASPTATCARASGSPRSRSAAPAASTAASPCPRSWSAGSRSAASTPAPCTATWGASDAAAPLEPAPARDGPGRRRHGRRPRPPRVAVRAAPAGRRARASTTSPPW